VLEFSIFNIQKMKFNEYTMTHIESLNRLIYARIKKYVLPRGFVLLADVVITATGFLVAYVLRFNFHVDQIPIEEAMLQFGVIVFPSYLGAFLLSCSYQGIIRHSSIEDMGRFSVAIGAAMLTVSVISVITNLGKMPGQWFVPYSVVLIHAAVTTVMLMGFRLIVRGMYHTYVIPKEAFRSVLIFGAGMMGQITHGVLENDRYSSMNVEGFIDDNKALIGKRLSGIPIYSEAYAFRKVIKRMENCEIIIAISHNNIKPARKKALLDCCLRYGVNIREVPPLKDWIDGSFSSKQIREIKIEDLLGRDPIWLDQDRVAGGLKNSVEMVTGAAGSIGSEIVRQLMAFDSRLVVLVDQAESALYDLQNELLATYPPERFEVVVANVTDQCRMRHIFEKYRPQYVYNAAAYKHVPLMEASPYEAIRVNVGGTRLLADLSVEFGVQKFVMISTDKAVNPTNVMGASKRICEIYVQALTQLVNLETQFITTRFGNVLGSNGSVVPLFRKQIEAGGPVTVTHPEIIRYFMTIPEACQLVLEAGFMGRGGEIYVFDMGEPVKIYDLAVKMISLAGFKPEVDIPIQITGLRPGEKLYEELLADKENTVLTHHPKIRVAKVRKHDFIEVKSAIDSLLNKSQIESEAELVCLMKDLIPEFISQNSKYSIFDKTVVFNDIKESTNGKIVLKPKKLMLKHG
jgi:FlaA1/EpsC-like NDP-sugar epimerase